MFRYADIYISLQYICLFQFAVQEKWSVVTLVTKGQGQRRCKERGREGTRWHWQNSRWRRIQIKLTFETKKKEKKGFRIQWRVTG